MMSGVMIGRIWGIPIRLHGSWFIVFGLLTWSLSREIFTSQYPGLSLGVQLLLGMITSLLFFASVLAHELGHSWLALKDGIPVRGITLFIFGGVAQIEREPRSPMSEFRIAIAGPLTSLGLAGFFGLLYLLDRQIPFLAAPSEYLMRINFILALFNLIPGFPLDGGRVLRAIVWASNKDFKKATRIASISGQVIAYLFIGYGIFRLFMGQFVDGFWMIFIGWFLQNAASSVFQQVNLESVLKGTTVGEVMYRGIIKLPGLTPLNYVVEEQVISHREPVIYVTEYGEVSGILSIKEIMKIPKPHWRFTTLNQAMVPFSRSIKLDPETDLFTALKQMEEKKIALLPVLSGDQLVGTLTKEGVIHFVNFRTQMS